MMKRVLASLFGALLLGVLVPLCYALLISAPGNLSGYAWLAGIGAVIGAVLGALFPKVFGFVFETIFGI